MEIQRLLSMVATNRAQYFRLIQEVERVLGRKIDERDLEASIDAELNGRETVSEAEAYRLVLEAVR